MLKKAFNLWQNMSSDQLGEQILDRWKKSPLQPNPMAMGVTG